MDLWSGVVRVPLAVKNRKIIGSGDNKCYYYNDQKKGHNPESGTCTTLREGSYNQYFQIYGKYFYGAKKQMNIWSRVVRVPLLVIEETKGYLK